MNSLNSYLRPCLDARLQRIVTKVKLCLLKCSYLLIYAVCACTKDYVYVYDGVPLYPGFSSEGARLLATLCGSNVDDELTVTAHSGVMAVFFEAIVHPTGTLDHTFLT